MCLFLHFAHQLRHLQLGMGWYKTLTAWQSIHNLYLYTKFWFILFKTEMFWSLQIRKPLHT